jgi:hypothetical protein
VETIDFHGSSQMVALASPVGCWQEYELFHGSFSESNVPATLEQQSGLGAQLAMALGFVLLIFGCVAEWRARRAAAEHDVPVRIPDHLPRMSRLAVAAAVWAPFAVVVLALFLTKHDDTPQAIAVEVRREQPAVIRDTKLDEAKRGPDVETPPKRSAGQVSRPQPGAETRTPAATDGNVVIAAPQSRPDSTTHGPAWWQWLLIFTVLPVGIAAPFGTTILGGIALTQIRHSAGRLYGLGLALADTLLFPILLIDLVIFYFAAMIDNLALIVAVDSLLIYWGWRIANAPVPSKPLTDTGY